MLAQAPANLLDELRADPFTYFRFINRAWIARVCEAFADVPGVPIVRLHGDAHVEQFAVARGAWGLDDFDDYAQGPVFVDIIRFLGSIDLATRNRGWTRDRDALWGAGAASGDAVTAPMQGTVVKVAVEEGQEVAAGDLIVVLEAMKMENPVNAHKAGIVTGLSVEAGAAITQGTVLAELK